MKTKLLRKLRLEARRLVCYNVHWFDVSGGELTGLYTTLGTEWMFEGSKYMPTTWESVGPDLARVVARNIWRKQWRYRWTKKGYGARGRGLVAE